MKNSNSDQEATVVAAYLRVSSSRQATEGDSLEAQRNAINAFVTQKESLGEWADVQTKFYVDAGKSGKDSNRPEFRRLRKDIESRGVDVVISVKFDRLSRNVIDLLQFRNFLANHGVELVSIRENFDTTTPYGKFALHLLASVAEMERDLISERTSSVMEDRARRGLWNGRPPHGYRLEDDGDGRLVVDDSFASIIREQFFNTAERLGSAGAVARYLRSVGVTVPSHRTRTGRQFGGKSFDARQVKNVLTNRAYLGEVHWGGVVSENAHEAIVDQDQFDRVQRILEKARTTNSNPEYQGDYVFLLKQLVRCGCCGAAMTPYSGTGRNGRYYYYACTTRCHKGKTTCAAPFIPAAALDRAILNRCIHLAADEADKDRIIGDAIKQANTHGQQLEAEIQTVNRRAGDIQREIKNLVSALRTLGADGVESVREELISLEEEKRHMVIKLDELKTERGKVSQMGELESRFIEGWRGVGELLAAAEPSQQRKLLSHIVEMVEWAPSSGSSKVGTYRIRFFPESVVEHDGFLLETWPGNDDGPDNAGPLLTPVRKGFKKAPLAGYVSNFADFAAAGRIERVGVRWATFHGGIGSKISCNW